MPVPLFASSLDPYMERISHRLAEVARSGRYILGPEVAAFEDEFAAHLGARFCVGVANGTDAIAIALRALGVGPGDEVVVPSFTFYATAEAVAAIGAVPVLCDVDPRTFCVTRATVEAAMSARTRAVVAVHLFGNVVPVAELRELGVPVLEDAAQAAGASAGGRAAGSLGDAATFSFFPSKNLPCLGDGGAVVTDREDVAALARRLRFHGSEDKVTHTEVGYNSRLDAIQAAVLRELLPELDGWSAARRAAAAAYIEEGLGEIPGIEPPAVPRGVEHGYHLFVVRHDRADELVDVLAAEGVEARGYYRAPLHRQPAMAGVARTAPDLGGTEAAARSNVALPMGTRLGTDAIREVVQALERATGATARPARAAGAP